MKIINRIFYSIGFLLVFLLVGIIVALNSSLLIKKVASKYAGGYGVEYSSIDGNILNGVTISGLHYKGYNIASKITFRWNPVLLLNSTLMIDKLHFVEVDVTSIEKMLSALPKSDSNDTSSSPLPKISIRCRDFHLDTLSFNESNISFTKVLLDAKGVDYTLGLDGVDLSSFALDIDSNISKLSLEASLEDRELHLKNIDISRVDIDTLLAMSRGGDKSKQDEDLKGDIDDNQTKKDNLWIPKVALIDTFHIDTLQATIKPLHLYNFDLNLSKLDIDISDKLVKKGNVSLNVVTNLSKVNHRGKILDNEYKGEVNLLPNGHLFDLYKLPLRKEAFGNILIDFDLTQNIAKATITSSAKEILMLKDKSATKEFNVDIDTLKSDISYRFVNGYLKAKTDITISTPYAKGISIHNDFDMNKSISYSGDIAVKQILKLDRNITRLIDNLHINYSGGVDRASVDLNSSKIMAHIVSDDMRHFDVKLDSRDIELSSLADLPKALKGAKAKVSLEVPIDVKDMKRIDAKAKIISNMVDIDSDIEYSKSIKVSSKLNLSRDSLLYGFDKNLKLNSLFPMSVDAKVVNDKKSIRLNSSRLKGDMTLNGSVLDGYIKLATLKSKVNGDLDGVVRVETKVSSIKTLLSTIQEIYKLNSIPKIDGDLNSKVELDKSKNISLELSSSAITIRDKKRSTRVDDIAIKLSKKGNDIYLNSYRATYDKFKIFATKSSLIQLDKSNIKVAPFWVNDKLKVSGVYDMLHSKGDINAIAKMLHISHELIDLDSDLDITTSIDGDSINVDGEVILEGGQIHYDLNKKTFASDDDIIIVQNMKKKKNSSNDNLNMNIQISSKKPLLLKQKGVNIKANVDLMVNKQSGSSPLLVGAIELQKGGSYIFEDKKFVFDKSYIYFTGEANKPYLDITLKYKSVNYLIKIMVAGTPDIPVISFSSQPPLSKEQILSVILFDSADGAGNNSGEDMMRMMGGAMAKSALSSVGIKLDHLVIGEGNSIEVGKKIGEKTTVIYINGEVPTIKVKYEHTPHLESVIGANEKSQSYDIVYKKDYKRASDIILLK